MSCDCRFVRQHTLKVTKEKKVERRGQLLTEGVRGGSNWNLGGQRLRGKCF